MNQLNRKNILITGGGRGLGRALAIELAKRGANVVVVARTDSEIAETKRIIESDGAKAHAITADIGDKESIYPLVARAAALIGPIDILINNASVLGPVPLRLVLDTDCEDFEMALQVNAIGPLRLMKAVAGHMLLNGYGTILNLSSDAAVETYPRWGAYSASKAALDHLTRILAAEMQETPLKILTVDPGEMDTRMHADAVPDADRAILKDPNEVAKKMVRILEQVSSYPTGSRIPANEVEL